MGTVLVAVLDGFVGQEPDIATAPASTAGRPPPRDIRPILIRDPERQPVHRHTPRSRELEDELVAVVYEPRAVDWLVVAEREVAVDAGGRASHVPVDGHRL